MTLNLAKVRFIYINSYTLLMGLSGADHPRPSPVLPGMGMAIDVGGELPNARRTPEGANMCSGPPTGI